MKISYSRTPLEKSIFLAGPTPRGPEASSWRPEALRILEDLKFNGTVFVPEESDGSFKFTYDNQVEWELQALHSATVVLFWVPREMQYMPGLTTNVEFGMFAARRNVVLGYPLNADRMKYLQYISTMYDLPIEHDIVMACKTAIALTERPFKTTKIKSES